MKDIPMLKAIFFDAVGTLIHLPRSVGEHYREVGLRFGLRVETAALEKAFRAAWAGSPARVSGDGGPRPDDDKGWWQNLVENVLRSVLSESELRVFEVKGYFEAVYQHFSEPGVWAAYPDVLDVLGALHEQGYALGVISNFDRRLYRVFEHLGLREHFRTIVISSEVGADKPDPFIFQQALGRLQLPAGEAMHVGDDPKCDWGAAAVGLRVFRLERPAHTLWDLMPALAADASP